MLIEANVEYQYRGLPAPIFSGTISVTLNIHQDATDDQIEEELAEKAKQTVARKMCFEPTLIVIVALLGIERTLTDYEYDRIHA